MASLLKKLATHKSSGAATTAVYQVPSGKVGKVNVSVVNNSGTTANVILFVSPTSTPAADYTIQVDTLTVSNTGYERTGLILKPTEWLCYKTDQAGINIVVTGIEEDSLGDCVSTSTLITTNTDTTIYSNAAGKEGAFNITLSLAEGTSSDSVTVELYVTTTNVAGGHLLQKDTLRMSSITGYERGGLCISTTDKLIVRTTGISGQLAARVEGFPRG